MSALPCRGGGLPASGSPALGALREVRERLWGCLRRGATRCSSWRHRVVRGGPVRSLVQLSLEPEFRRPWRALDALAVGRVDDERLFCLLTEVLPPLAYGCRPGPWNSRSATSPACGRPNRGTVRDAAPAGGGCGGRGRRDAASPARRVVLPGPRARSPRGVPRQGLQQDHPGLGAPARRRHRALAHRLGLASPASGAPCLARPDRPDDRPGNGRAAPPAGRAGRCRCSCRWRGTAPPRSPAGCPAARPISWSGSRQQRLLPGRALLARQERAPPAPEPDDNHGFPHSPLYGTVRAEAWHGVHPQVHGDRGWLRRPGQASRPARRPPPRHRRAAARRPRPAPPDVALARRPGPRPRASSGVPTSHGSPSTQHAIRTPKGTLGRTAAKVRAPRPADRWARVGSRPTPSSSRRPPPPTCAAPGKQPGPATVPRPGSAGGFRNIRRQPANPRPCPESRPPLGLGSPKATSKGPAPRHLLPGQADMPTHRPHPLTRQR